MSGPEENSAPVRVLIVEDHPVVAEGLAALLGEYPELTIVGVAESVQATSAAVDNLAVDHLAADVAIIDVHLPDGSGIDAADRIRERCPSTGIVFLSADTRDEVQLAAIEAGASSYLLKSASGDEIVGAIRSAARGELLIPAETMRCLLARERADARQHARVAALLASLTPREREILALMMHGDDNRAVARRLGISYATVRTHVRSILGKLGARSQLEAVARATEWGFHA